MFKLKKALLLLVILALSWVFTGCVIGVKENNEILFVSHVPIPMAAKGVPVIATNDKIRLSILDKPDKLYFQKVTGYVLVDPWTWKEMVDFYNDR